MLMVTAPAHLISIDPCTFKKIHKNKMNPASLLLKLREMTTRSALSNLQMLRAGRGDIIFKDRQGGKHFTKLTRKTST